MTTRRRSIELFAGAGGLALGVDAAGFSHEIVVEWDRYAIETLMHNVRNGHPAVSRWNVHMGDVREFDYAEYADRIDLVAGGPPCQPFSVGGKHRGSRDKRNMWPEAVRAVREVRPRAFVFENVRGLLRQGFRDYYEYVCMRLRYPELVPHEGETWAEHNERLMRVHQKGGSGTLRYVVEHVLFNAANFGVPQCRDRVFIIGLRADLNATWQPPRETHSRSALLAAQSDGSYWDEHSIRAEHRQSRLGHGTAGGKQRWRTIRDALAGLPDPQSHSARQWNGHAYQSGARSYPGHTGSPIDWPSKALKAGVHGVPGGENTVVLRDGTIRYLTVREGARVQTFPDDFEFIGTWSETMRQLGNAVPVLLAKSVADTVMKDLEEADIRRRGQWGFNEADHIRTIRPVAARALGGERCAGASEPRSGAAAAS